MFFTMSVFFPVALIFFIPQIVFDTAYSPMKQLSPLLLLAFVPFLVICFALLNKDYYRAKSVAKRIYGYSVLDIRTNQIASRSKCAIRNITAFIWPVEVLMLLVNPERRLGDFLAGTTVKNDNVEAPELILNDIKDRVSYGDAGALYLPAFLAILMLILSSFPLWTAL